MTNITVILPRKIDNNPLTLLLLYGCKNINMKPPEGFTFLADENHNRLLDENRGYLLERREDSI